MLLARRGSLNQILNLALINDMPENPFESFFSGVSGGFAAGRERRSLSQLAEGDPTVQVPGFGETFLQGFNLSRTMPKTASEQTARQVAEGQLALGFMNAEIRRNELVDRTANQILSSGIKLREQKQDLADAEVLANETVRMTDLLRLKDFTALETAVPPEGLSVRGIEKWENTKFKLLDTESAKLAGEFVKMKDRLSAMEIPTEGMTLDQMQAEYRRNIGLQQVQDISGSLGQTPTSISQSVSATGNVSTQATFSTPSSAAAKTKGMTDATLASTFLNNDRKIAQLEGDIAGAIIPQDKAKAQAEIDGLRQQNQFLSQEAGIRGVALPTSQVAQAIPGTVSRAEMIQGIFEAAQQINARNEQR